MTAEWIGEPERLDRALATLELARSRTHAASLVANGQVTLNESVAEKTSAKVRDGDRVTIDAPTYVSRAAHKLLDALDDDTIDPTGKLALDLGASTGGFTQVLLERGASRVIAIDVGHDQMVPDLRTDPRVVLVEGCNARYLTREHLADLTGVTDAPQVIVADLSFISLTHVLGPIRSVAAAGADIIVLIKPQFEVGREHIGGGVVEDPALHEEAINRVLDAARSEGLTVNGVRPTTIVGTHGNQEFIAHLSAPGQE